MTISGAVLEGLDFLDLGASKGDSLRYCSKRFGGTGLGVDVDAAKVEAARRAGHRVLHADAAGLDAEDVVRYVAGLDFFEHLPDLATAKAILASAARAATDFIFIRHPSFEGAGLLKKQGFYQYWHAWTGHRNPMLISDFCDVFEELGLTRYFIRWSQRIERSSHPSILPAPITKNQHEYDPDLHGPKRDVELIEPVWRQQEIFVALRDMSGDEWAAIVKPL